MQTWASPSVKPSMADHQPTYKMAVMWSKTTASVTSRLSFIILMGGFVDHCQQAVPPPWIHSILILEWISHCLSNVFLFWIDMFRILYIPIRRHFGVIHWCLPTWHMGCCPGFKFLTVHFGGSWTSIQPSWRLSLWSPLLTSMTPSVHISIWVFDVKSWQ